jgi:hypothetical protein
MIRFVSASLRLRDAVSLRVDCALERAIAQ